MTRSPFEGHPKNQEIRRHTCTFHKVLFWMRVCVCMCVIAIEAMSFWTCCAASLRTLFTFLIFLIVFCFLGCGWGEGFRTVCYWLFCLSKCSQSLFITLKTFFLEGALASLSTSLQRLKIKIPALFRTSSQFDLGKCPASFSSPSKVIFEGLSFNLHYVGSQGVRPDHSKHRYANNVNKSTLSSEYQNQQQTAVPNLIGRSTRLWDGVSFSFDSKELNSLDGWGIKYERPSCVSATDPFSLSGISHMSQDKYKPSFVLRQCLLVVKMFDPFRFSCTYNVQIAYDTPPV